MMNKHWRSRTPTLAVLAVGLPAAAFLTMTAASADEYDFSPDVATFVPSQVEGYPPLINEVTGAEKWNIFDLTTNSVKYSDVLSGTDTETTIGSFTNNDYLTNLGLFINIAGNPSVLVPADTQIDLADFGGGWENEWVNIPAGGTDVGASDLLITPFGDFALFGSFFSDLSSAIG